MDNDESVGVAPHIMLRDFAIAVLSIVPGMMLIVSGALKGETTVLIAGIWLLFGGVFGGAMLRASLSRGDYRGGI